MAFLPIGADGSHAAGGAVSRGASEHERPPAVGAIGKLGLVQCDAGALLAPCRRPSLALIG